MQFRLIVRLKIQCNRLLVTALFVTVTAVNPAARSDLITWEILPVIIRVSALNDGGDDMLRVLACSKPVSAYVHIA